MTRSLAVVFASALLFGWVVLPSCSKEPPKKTSPTDEAVTHVKKIYQAALAYHAAQARSGAPAFPASTGPTPGLSGCCETGEGTCQPDAKQWTSDPTWAALGFSITEPYFYSYQFINNGTSFTARAHGDLDCDGTLSTFEMFGTVVDGKASGSGSLRRVSALE